MPEGGASGLWKQQQKPTLRVGSDHLPPGLRHACPPAALTLTPGGLLLCPCCSLTRNALPRLTTPSPKASPGAGSSCFSYHRTGRTSFSPRRPARSRGPGATPSLQLGGGFTMGGGPAAPAHSPRPPARPHPPSTLPPHDVSLGCLGALQPPGPSSECVIMYAGVPGPFVAAGSAWHTKVHWISHSGLKDLLLRVYLIT